MERCILHDKKPRSLLYLTQLIASKASKWVSEWVPFTCMLESIIFRVTLTRETYTFWKLFAVNLFGCSFLSNTFGLQHRVLVCCLHRALRTSFQAYMFTIFLAFNSFFYYFTCLSSCSIHILIHIHIFCRFCYENNGSLNSKAGEN